MAAVSTNSTYLSSEDEAGHSVRSILTADEFMDLGLSVFFQEDKRNVSAKTNVDRFNSYYGCLPILCAMLWEDLQRTNTRRARVKQSKLVPKYFLMALHHLKVYPTEMQAEGPWGLTRKTYRKWVKYFLKKIRRLKAEKIKWPDDWADDEVWVMSVDGTHCWIAEPQHAEWSHDRKYYSHSLAKLGSLMSWR